MLFSYSPKTSTTRKPKPVTCIHWQVLICALCFITWTLVELTRSAMRMMGPEQPKARAFTFIFVFSLVSLFLADVLFWTSQQDADWRSVSRVEMLCCSNALVLAVVFRGFQKGKRGFCLRPTALTISPKWRVSFLLRRPLFAGAFTGCGLFYFLFVDVSGGAAVRGSLSLLLAFMSGLLFLHTETEILLRNVEPESFLAALDMKEREKGHGLRDFLVGKSFHYAKPFIITVVLLSNCVGFSPNRYQKRYLVFTLAHVGLYYYFYLQSERVVQRAGAENMLDPLVSSIATDEEIRSLTSLWHRLRYPTRRRRQAAIASERLLRLCMESCWLPDLASLETCITDEADVFAGLSIGTPVLHRLIREGNVEAVRVCLGTERPIVFTVSDIFSDTPLHAACDASLSNEQTTAMLEAIVQRLDSSPKDTVEWSKQDVNGKTFIDLAAEHQKLSSVAPLMRQVGYFRQQTRAYRLRHRVWKHDWGSLSDECRRGFSLEGQVIPIDAATATLVQCCWRMKAPHVVEQSKDGRVERRFLTSSSPEGRGSSQLQTLDVVQRCVADGADVLWLDPIYGCIPLHWLTLEGHVEAVAACLQTARRLSLRVALRDGRSPLHCICGPPGKGPETVESLLQLYLDRLDTHPREAESGALWGQKEGQGMDFLAVADQYGVHYVVWPILKARKVSYFVQYDGPMKEER